MPRGSNKLLLSWVFGLGGTAYCLYKFRQDSRKRQRGEEDSNKVPEDLLRQCPYSEELTLAVALALRAGNNMTGYCEAKGTDGEDQFDLGIVTKGQAEDFCTKIDVENERIVMEGIAEKFPDHNIIGEETVGEGSVPPLKNDYTWIIDPIDGTTNFSVGLPLTCVSIGLCVNKKPVLGVVYAPMTKELYIGVRGYGAYRNGIKLAHSSGSKKSLTEAIVCIEFGYPRDEASISKLVTPVQNLLRRRARALRQLGSGVLDLVSPPPLVSYYRINFSLTIIP